MNYKVDGWAEEALALSDNPTEGVLKIAEAHKDQMTEEMIRRLVEATNVRSFLDKKAIGHNMEDPFPVADANKIIATLVKDNLVKAMPKAAKEDAVIMHELPDYYAGYCEGVNEDLDFVATEKRASYNPSGFTWESKKEVVVNIDRTKLDARIKKEAHVHAAMSAAEYITKFAEYYSSNKEFVSELRYLYPNSIILKSAKLSVGTKKIPRVVLESHTTFKQADDVVRILNVKKKVKLAENPDIERVRAMFGVSQAPEKRRQTQEDATETVAQKRKKEGPIVQRELQAERPKAERAALGEKALTAPGAVRGRSTPSGLESGTEMAGLSYQVLRNQLGNIKARGIKARGISLAALPKQMPGYAFGKSQWDAVRRFPEEIDPVGKFFERVVNLEEKGKVSDAFEANTEDVVRQLKRRANFENIIVDDEVLEDADVNVLLDIYRDANKLAPEAMLVPSIAKAVLRAAHSHGTGAIDPESARLLVKLERELTGQPTYTS